MEGRHEDVETSPSPVSYAVSPLRDVDLSPIWPLPGVCHNATNGRSAAKRSQVLMSIWPFFM